jgi:hypothetical protein
MLFDISKVSPETRRRIEGLMSANGWGLEKALNEIALEAVSAGATSAVGRRKAKVLQLVTLKRASERDSSG